LTKLRACPESIEGTNVGEFEFIGEFPFVLRRSKHEMLFFSNLIMGETIEVQ
jgi:hypothetical protein